LLWEENAYARRCERAVAMLLKEKDNVRRRRRRGKEEEEIVELNCILA